MGQDRLARYIWLLETIRKYGRITRKELERRWNDTGFAKDGKLSRRTFHNYRNVIEELFGVNIECDLSTYEYYIAEQDSSRAEVTQWMFNNAAVNNILSDSSTIADRIIVEDVPSAREHLAAVIDAIKGNRRIRFTYSSYSRIKPKEGIVFEPYFLKLFRQRWYATGREYSPSKTGLRTYALDRMSSVSVLEDTFRMPADFNARVYTGDSFGIIFDIGEISEVRLRVSARRAKYLRALPLHHSQKETLIGPDYCEFTYNIKPTADFIEEILSMGPDITVITPKALREAIMSRLRETLDSYLDGFHT